MRQEQNRAAHSTIPILACAFAAWAGASLLTAAPAMGQSQDLHRLSADIPPEPLPRALRALAEQTGLRIVYVSTVVGQKRSEGANKGIGAREALTQVLEGTGLRYEFLTTTTVKIVPSSGQQADSAPSSLATEEVVISARWASEPAWTGPLSTSTVTGEELERSAIRGLDDLSVSVPGLSYSFARRLGGVPVVRGMSGVSAGSTENNVATLYDGIYVSNSFAVDITMLDLERVEVLRGPQNALVGRNAFAGAILYAPARPTSALLAQSLITVGGNGLLRESVVASGPLIGQLAGRLAAAYETFDGTIRNAADLNHNLGGWRKSAVSGSLQREAGQWSALLSGYWYRHQRDATARFSIGDKPPYLNCGLDPDTGKYINYCGPFPAPDSVDISSDARGQESNTYLGRLEFEWRWRALIFTSLTGFIDSAFNNAPDDADLSSTGELVPVSLASAPNVLVRYQRANSYYGGHPVDDHEWSEELRVTRSGSRVRWLLGIYWADNHSLEHEYASTDARGLAPGEIMPPDYNPTTTPLTTLPYHQASQHDKFLATFGSLSYDVTSALEASAQLRWNEQRTYLPNDGTSGTWALVTPRLSLAHRLPWSTQVYASVARGARAGGFNFSPVPTEQRYGPEDNWTYELGLKMTDGARPVQATMAVFIADWSHMQLSQPSSDPTEFGAVTRNLGSARVAGLELAFDARPTSWSELHIGYAHTDARFNPGTMDLSISTTCTPQICHMVPASQPRELVPDVGGNRVPKAPLDAGSVSVALHGGFSPAVRWDVELGIDVIGREYVSTDNLNWIQARHLPNARFAVAGSRWEAALWGRYLSNQNSLETVDLDLRSSYFIGDRANGASWGLSLLYHTL